LPNLQRSVKWGMAYYGVDGRLVLFIGRVQSVM